MIKPDAERCQTCADTGWEHYDRDGRSYVRRCQTCIERRRGHPEGLPKDELGQTWTDYTLTEWTKSAVEHGQLFVQGVHAGLYLWGRTGTGKTKLACIVAQECHKRGDYARFVRVPSLGFDLRPTRPEADELFDKLVQIPVLVLDDIGADKRADEHSNYGRRLIQMLFDKRADDDRRTIWTSNLSIDELNAFFEDERLVSRIAGTALAVEIKGADMRRGKPEALDFYRKRDRRTADKDRRTKGR